MSKNVFPTSSLNRKSKERMLKQHGISIWLTGLSSSGKTTIAVALEKELHDLGYLTQVLDGDNVRTGINGDLGFSAKDRIENIRRASEMTKLFVQSGLVTICCFISPNEKLRNAAKEVIGSEDFFEIYVSTPLEECENRDVKGLYKKARRGEIKDFTGVDAKYQPPLNPSMIVDTLNYSVEDLVQQILDRVRVKIEA